MKTILFLCFTFFKSKVHDYVCYGVVSLVCVELATNNWFVVVQMGYFKNRTHTHGLKRRIKIEKLVINSSKR